MYKYIIMCFLCVFVAFGAMAAESNKVSGWADAPTFCKTHNISGVNYNDCLRLVEQYKKATTEHFRNLSADQLKRISRSINKLANKNSKHHKSLRDAVKGIGDTIRKPIEIPPGVRMRSVPQQQYIK